MKIACFVSSHGFGHAARASAIMQGLIDRVAAIEFDIYSQTVKAFFESSLSRPINYFECYSDVGLLQLSPLQSDVDGSLPVINEFLDRAYEDSEALAVKLIERCTDLVICDISPLGLLVANKAGIPSILVENFTWDWIYEDFLTKCPAYKIAILRLREINKLADYRIKTRPFCDDNGQIDLIVEPLCRSPRRSIDAVRKELGVPENKKLILLTLGGISADNPFLGRLKTFNNVYFLVTGTRTSKKEDNIILLQNDASVYLADHLNACDAVIAKLGYSTVAETWAAGLPMMYITRDDFRESRSLADFVDNAMRGIALSEYDYASGEWLSRIDELLAMPRVTPEHKSRALDSFADFVTEHFIEK